MTGRRKRKGKPVRVVKTIQNSRALFEQRLAQASEPGHLTSAAAGYFLAVLRRTNPSVAESLDRQWCQALMTEAERLDAAALTDLRKRRERDDDRNHRPERHAG